MSLLPSSCSCGCHNGTAKHVGPCSCERQATKGPTGMCGCDPKFQPDRKACRLAIYASLPSQGCKCRCHEPEWAVPTTSHD